MRYSGRAPECTLTSSLCCAGAGKRLPFLCLLMFYSPLLLYATPAQTEPLLEPYTIEANSPGAYIHSRVEPSLAGHMQQAAEKGMLYRIQPEASEIGFRIDSPIGLIEASFKNFEGDFTLEKGRMGIEGKALLSVNMDSVEMESGFIRAMLMSETFLDTDRYPKLQFISQDFFWVNNWEAILIGDLTMHGVTQRIGLHVHLISAQPADAQNPQRIRLEASAQILRSAFGMHSLTSLVSDKVDLYMKIQAIQYQESLSDRLTLPAQ